MDRRLEHAPGRGSYFCLLNQSAERAAPPSSHISKGVSMARPRLRMLHWALLAAVICTSGAVFAIGKVGKTRGWRDTALRQASLQKGKPKALAQHLERLKQSLPGNGGESVNG